MLAMPEGPPIITSVPPTEATVGNGYLYTLAARDAENDPLTYRILTAPTGMAIVEATGEISWTPTIDQTGQQSVLLGCMHEFVQFFYFSVQQ